MGGAAARSISPRLARDHIIKAFGEVFIFPATCTRFSTGRMPMASGGYPGPLRS